MLDWFLNLDDRLFTVVNQNWSHPNLDSLMKILSSSKTFIPFYLWAIYRLIQRFQHKSWIPVMLAVVAFGLADSISSRVFKPGFERLRPAFESHLNARLPDGMPGGKYGFVSSHSANAFAVYPLLLGLVFYRKDLQISQHKTWKYSLILVFVVAFLIAYSRVYLGRHYVGDVLFGGILGGLIGFSIWKLYTKVLFEKYLSPN